MNAIDLHSTRSLAETLADHYPQDPRLKELRDLVGKLLEEVEFSRTATDKFKALEDQLLWVTNDMEYVRCERDDFEEDAERLSKQVQTLEKKLEYYRKRPCA